MGGGKIELGYRYATNDTTLTPNDTKIYIFKNFIGKFISNLKISIKYKKIFQ